MMGSDNEYILTIDKCEKLHADIEIYINLYGEIKKGLRSLKPTQKNIAEIIFDCILFMPSESPGNVALCDANLEWLSKQPIEKLYSSINIIGNPKDSSYELPVEDRVELAKELVYKLIFETRQTKSKLSGKRGIYAKKTGD